MGLTVTSVMMGHRGVTSVTSGSQQQYGTAGQLQIQGTDYHELAVIQYLLTGQELNCSAHNAEPQSSAEPHSPAEP